MELEEIIKREIRKRGPIPFRDFMEMALYHPDLGYYTTPGEKTGKRGDYYTSPDVGPVFGELLCLQLEEMWSILGGGEFTIVEMGAGKGYLCGDILGYLNAKRRDFYKGLKYVIVEKSPEMRRRQFSLLKEMKEKITWADSLEDLAPVEKGCFLSNELVDAFPVHIVENNNGLKEVFVDWDGGFVEVLGEPSTPKLEDYFSQLGVVLGEGCRGEVNLDALDWIGELSGLLRKGFVVTIDYGYPAAELYSSLRPLGTLLCYHRHSVSEDPYERIGHQDITAHVNFSALVHWGKKNGLEFTGFTDQTHFILGLLEGYLEDLGDNYWKYLQKILPIKKLMLPEGMGGLFKVLIQHKGVEKPDLLGLKFKRSSFNSITL
jgi:SAM-dependent MidA family methyltransferase